MKSDIKDRIKKLNQGQIPEGFKRIQGQIIPDSWNIYKLEELIASSDYGTSEQTNDTKGYPVLRMGNLVDGKISIENLVYVDLDRESFNNLKLEKGDLLFNRTNSYDLVGKVSLFDLDGDYTFASYLIRLKVINSKVLPKYLNYYMNLESSQRQIKTFSTKGVQQVNVNITTLKKFFKVKLPSNIFEQQKIIDILSTWDKAIELKEKLIEQKKEQKKGLMQRLLTGKVRLPGFEGEWKEVRLGDIIEFYNGYPFKSSTYKDGGKYKIITIANVQDGKLDLSKCNLIDEIPDDLQDYQILKQGDILLSMTGNVGRVCIVDEDNCLLNQRVGKIHPKKVDKWFLYFILRSERFLKEMMNKAQGGAQGNLSVKDIKEYKLVIPDISEQEKLGKLLRMNEREVTLLEQEKKLLIEQKKGLMQLLLTGKVRVKC